MSDVLYVLAASYDDVGVALGEYAMIKAVNATTSVAADQLAAERRDAQARAH